MLKHFRLPGRAGTLSGSRRPKPAADLGLVGRYVSSAPTAQNAVDAVPGWSHAFPAGAGVATGAGTLYDDPRIHWCVEQMGSLQGRTVLELGPLEAMHTHMLARAGAARIDAVEANTLAFLRCLVTREILRIENARFHLGDFSKWLEEVETRYDLVVASGVLYHSPDPLRLLRLIAGRTDRFYLWTHYVDDALLAGDLRGGALSGKVVTQDFEGVEVRLHERSYHQRWSDPSFCGGYNDVHFWLERQSILGIVDRLGFDATIGQDIPEHVNGPSFSLFARRRDPASS